MDGIDPFDTDAFREAAREHQARTARIAPLKVQPAGPRDAPPYQVQEAALDNGFIRPNPARASCFFSAADLKDRPVPAREWCVPDWVPHRNVTLFNGDGGTGKSLYALQLATAKVLGSTWAARPVRQGAVIFISAEDEEDELHRRLDDILRAEGRSYEEVAALTLRSLAGEDALLAFETQLGLIQSTLFEDLDTRASADAPDLVIIDTLADVFPANENDRAKARQFIGILRGLALRRNCAVMLLAHPSVAGMASGTGTSGSTAWNNSVRSRLYLERVISDGYEANPDARILRTKKANYGRTGIEIGLTWQEGAFRVEAVETGLDRMARGAKAERVFLKLLRLFEEQGRYVSAQPGPTYAPSVFAAHPDAEGMTKAALRSAMEGAMQAGLVCVAVHGSGAKARSHLSTRRPE